MKRNAKKAKGIERKGKKDRNLYNSRVGSYREPRKSVQRRKPIIIIILISFNFTAQRK